MLTFKWCQHLQLLVEGHKLFSASIFNLAYIAEACKLPGLPIRGVNMTEEMNRKRHCTCDIIGGGWCCLQIRLCNLPRAAKMAWVLRLSVEKNCICPPIVKSDIFSYL